VLSYGKIGFAPRAVTPVSARLIQFVFGTVGEVWSLFFATFLRADSKSCAVFAAATIEFIAEFNAWWTGGFPGALIVSVMLIPLDFALPAPFWPNPAKGLDQSGRK
jgi:hypothetical protein